MGRRSKRKKIILRKLNAGQQVPDQELIRNGLGRIVEENSVRIQKLKEAQEAEEKAAKLKAEAEAAKLKAKEEAKKEAELKAKKETEVKTKKTTPVKKTPRKRAPKRTTKNTYKLSHSGNYLILIGGFMYVNTNFNTGFN